MLEQLELGNMQTITIKKSVANWTKTEKEINIAGRLFDVKEFDIQGDCFVLKGLFDEKENELIALIKEAQTQSNKSHPLQHCFTKIANKVFYVENINWFNFSSSMKIAQNFITPIEEVFVSFCPELVAPPPKA